MRAEHYPTPPKFLHGHNARRPPKPIEPGPLCACGCGERAKSGNTYINGHNHRGGTHSAEARAAISAAMTGPRNHRFGVSPHNYLGGTIVHKDGYRMIRMPDHPISNSPYVMEHRLLVEDYLRTNEPESEFLIDVGGTLYLHRGVDVHHKDENKLHNELTNLEAMWRSDHARLHHYTSEEG